MWIASGIHILLNPMGNFQRGFVNDISLIGAVSMVKLRQVDIRGLAPLPKAGVKSAAYEVGTCCRNPRRYPF